jgi:phosphonatase-like hydrolase
MSIQLIVFDIAGTTLKDNQQVHLHLQNALQQFEIKATLEEINAVMGYPKPEAIELILQNKTGNRLQLKKDFIMAIHHSFQKNMIRYYKTNPEVQEKSGVSDTFRKLRETGIKIAIDTGFDRPITDAILERTGWLKNHLVDVTVTSDEVNQGRPHPDMVLKAMKLTGITDPALVAKVGDTASDLQEGTAAGCGMVIGVTSGAFSREELQKEPHTHLIDEIPEILELLNITELA